MILSHAIIEEVGVGFSSFVLLIVDLKSIKAFCYDPGDHTFVKYFFVFEWTRT